MANFATRMRPSFRRFLSLCLLAAVVPLFVYFYGPIARIVGVARGSWCSGKMRQGPVNRYIDVDYDRVVNPHNFSFLVAGEDKCRTGEGEGVFLLVIIHSSPVHSELRNIQRRSTLGEKFVLGRRVVVVYMIGLTREYHLNSRVTTEAHEYHDIILGDYVDAYHNLTRKFMMGMKWASQFCAHAPYVLKGDDDVYFNLHNIVSLLETAPSSNYMAGYVYGDATPYREKRSKWFISEADYPNGCYPPFCRGYAILLSGDLPSKLFGMALRTPFFPMDDVFVGFLAVKLGITPTNTFGFRGPGNGDRLSFCSLNLSYAVHVTDSNEIASLWKEQQSPSPRWSCSRLIYFVQTIV